MSVYLLCEPSKPLFSVIKAPFFPYLPRLMLAAWPREPYKGTHVPYKNVPFFIWKKKMKSQKKSHYIKKWSPDQFQSTLQFCLLLKKFFEETKKGCFEKKTPPQIRSRKTTLYLFKSIRYEPQWQVKQWWCHTMMAYGTHAHAQFYDRPIFLTLRQ